MVGGWATRDDGICVEFRGKPYHSWDEAEDSAMSRLHGLLKTINVSQLHSSGVETLTPWHPEWNDVNAMFEQALQGESAGGLGKGQALPSPTPVRRE